MLLNCLPPYKTYKIEITYQNGDIDTVISTQREKPYLYMDGCMVLRGEKRTRICGIRYYRIL